MTLFSPTSSIKSTKNNQSFTSPNGFDLGKLENILITGSKTLVDKILIVKYDSSSGKYFLFPQEKQTIHGSSSTKFILGLNDYNFNETFIFTKTIEYSEDTKDQTIVTIAIDLENKTQAIFAIKGQLFAKEYNNEEIYEYYSFCTGKTILYESSSLSSILLKRIQYDKFLYLFNNNKVVYVGDSQYKRFDFTQNIGKQYLIPYSSTIGNSPLGNDIINMNNLPYIELEETTNGTYLIHIKCNRLQTDTNYIKWFGNFELTITAK